MAWDMDFPHLYIAIMHKKSSQFYALLVLVFFLLSLLYYVGLEFPIVSNCYKTP